MAYVDEIQDDEEGQGGQGSSEVITSSGSGSTVASGGNQGSNQAAADGQEKASSTGWTNLQSYIGANKDNAARMGQKVTGDISAVGQGAVQEKQALGSEVTADVAKNTVRDSGLINQLSADPTKVNKQAYTQQSTATYGGPTDLSSYNRYADVQKKVQNLGQKLQATESDAGRKALLAESYARPDYGQGMQSLDNFILSASPESVQQIQNTRQQYGNVGSEWDALQGQLSGAISQGRETTERTAADTKAAYERAFGQSLGQVTEAERIAQETNAARDAKIADLTSKISSGDPNVRAQGYQEAGIDPAVAEYLLANGVSPARVIQDMGDVGIGNYLSAADRARYEALAALENRGITRDLARTGSVTDFGLDTDFLSKAGTARDIQTRAEQRAASDTAGAKAYEDFLRDRIAQGAFGWGEDLGISRDDYLSAFDYGIDPTQYITSATARDTGDVLSSQERQQWADLMNALGLQSNFKYQDTNQEQDARFRAQDLARVVSEERARRQAEAAAEAARLAEIERQRQILAAQQEEEARRERELSQSTNISGGGQPVSYGGGIVDVTNW